MTTNYILTKMEEDNMSDEVLQIARIKVLPLMLSQIGY